ncbi:DNA-directed RNA polymerase III subunit RPC8, partial [Thoreauomyces humboldtii]
MRDNVRTHPADFRKPRSQALMDALNAKYANKILQNVGLGIRVWDVLEASDEMVHMVQDGSSQSKVTFRLVVFRPFKSEIIQGKVVSHDPINGVRGFFDDILIPPPFLMQPAKFHDTDKAWYWEYDPELPDDAGLLFYYVGDVIRFKMEVEEFVDVGPVRPGDPPDPNRKAPYSLIASCAEPGLGLPQWWGGNDDEEGEE